MIELAGVGKRFAAHGVGRGARSVHALRDVDLAVPAGETWAVVGPNGAGKSTLFALLLGFLQPTAGRMRVDGLEPRRYVRRNGAAYLPERFALPGDWTVRQTLRALASLERLSPADVRRRVDDLMARFELEPHAGKPLGALSRGLVQRVGLAQTLLAERRLVVLDEPAEGLDPLWRLRFRELAEELRREDRTVLIASHDLAEVERVADRVVLLDGGRVREIMEARGAHDGPRQYRLELASPAADAVATAFPDAVPADGGAGGGVSFFVTAGDASELSARLAALLDAGAVLTGVSPVAADLEARVRKALDGGGAE